MSKIPKYVLEANNLTSRQWRALKRRQLRAIEKAFAEYRRGCAYAPSLSRGDVDTLANALSRMIRDHSVANWDRAAQGESAGEGGTKTASSNIISPEARRVSN